jgi:triphosphoribosyl-dephospho-CoA synthase
MTADEVGAAAQLACLLEASAPKPGNVSPGRHFSGLRYEDLLASAVAIGPAMAGAGARRVGATVRSAIEATHRWTHSNTNLGIVLLLAPLVSAAHRVSHRMSGLQASRRLRDEVRRVLQTTSVADARNVFAAIRLAAPGGLGRVDRQDVAHEPTVTLLEAMALSADRDQIAREYATGFETTFEVGAPALARARGDGLTWDDAIVETFLTLLAGAADTHIVRRSGGASAAAVSRRAQAVRTAGGVRSAAGRLAIEEMDRALRDERHSCNPGATADLVAAAVFVALVGDGVTRARAPRPAGQSRQSSGSVSSRRPAD